MFLVSESQEMTDSQILKSSCGNKVVSNLIQGYQVLFLSLIPLEYLLTQVLRFFSFILNPPCWLAPYLQTMNNHRSLLKDPLLDILFSLRQHSILLLAFTYKILHQAIVSISWKPITFFLIYSWALPPLKHFYKNGFLWLCNCQIQFLSLLLSNRLDAIGYSPWFIPFVA